MQRGAYLKPAIMQLSRRGGIRLGWSVLVLALATFGLSQQSFGQEPPQRQIRAFIPPDQIVSFLPTTPFQTFLDNLNPIFVQVTGKRVIDPENRDFAIGVSVVGMQFFDAFELVLDAHDLTFRETDRYFLVENAPAEDATFVQDEQGRKTGRPSGSARSTGPTPESREIQIEAVMFEINHSNIRQQGIDWSIYLGQTAQARQSKFDIKSKDFFDNFDSWLEAPPTLAATELNSFFRFTEQSGFGTTLAQPKVTVRSGEQGRIQIGSDVPIQVRDFAGNTITQFVSTGIIVQVTPTLISGPVADSLGAPTLDFIHLKVRVDRSQAVPAFGGLSINRSVADTDVLLLDGEMTTIAGLYTTDEAQDRAGIPVLKDLPWWVLGLRYVFGKETKTETNRELLIVLRASVIESLPHRAESPYDKDHHLRSRRQALEILERFDPRVLDKWPLGPERLDKVSGDASPPNDQ